MKRAFSVVVVGLFLGPSIAPAQIGTKFTYQGRLSDVGAPANGVYDFQLVLYNAPVGGTQQGVIVTREDVTVTNGLFTVTLDFGPVFDGAARYLEVGVRTGASPGPFTTVGPRQELTANPHAVYAAKAGDATTVAGLTCLDGQVAKWSGSAWSCGPDDDTAPTASAPITVAANNVEFTPCAANQTYKMNASGTAWICAIDIDTNTTYSAGSGLSLVGTQFSTDNNVVARKDPATGHQAFDTNVLYLDYTNNRVGVVNAAPAEALDVVGTTRSTDFTYRTTKASAYRVAGVNFMPEAGATIAYTTPGYLYLTGTTTYAELFAPVHVPDGATITGVSCDIYDNQVTYDISSNHLSLYRRGTGAISGPLIGGLAFAATTGASTSIITRTATFTHVVDAESYAYYMVFGMTVGAASSNLRFYGCALTYTMPGPAY